MSLNVHNAEDALLWGKAKWETFLADFQKEWSQPQVDTLMRATWDTLPPEVHQQLQQMSPAAYGVVSQAMQRKV
jgi:hypothetical protein